MPKQKKSSELSEELISDFFRNINIIENLANHGMQRLLPGQMRYSHYAVLSFLVKHPDQNAPALVAEVFHLKRPSMTNTLNKLESMGFISLKANPTDGRAKLVSVTSAGQSAQKAAREALLPAYEEAINVLGADMLKELLPRLLKVRKFLIDTYS